MRIVSSMRSKHFWVLGLALAACGSTGTADGDRTQVPVCPAIAPPAVDVPEPPDGVSACPAGACNYQSQEGCGATQACRPSFNAVDPVVNPGCESVGAGVSGAACSAQSECARGYYCAEQQCHKLCCGDDWSACPDGESCFVSLSVRAGGQVMPSGAGLCYPVGACDPFTPSSCPAGKQCGIVDARGSAACITAGQAQAGESCAAPARCAAGLLCVDVDVGGTPTPLCRKLCAAEACGMPACAAEEGLCKHFNRDPAGVGECTP